MAANIAYMWRKIFSRAGAEVDGTEQLFYAYVGGAETFRSRWMNGSVGWKQASPMIRGTKYVRWERIVLNELFKNITPEVYMYNAHSLVEIAEALFNKYGVPYDPNWVRNAAVNGNRLEYTVALDFNDNQWAMFSRQSNYDTDHPLIVTVKQPSMDLATLYTDTVVTEPTMPYVVRAGYTNTEILSFSLDFTPTLDDEFRLLQEIASDADLNDVTADPTKSRAEYLVRLLGERLGIPTTVEADIDGALTTAGAKFVYNGPSVGISVANTQYDNVLVFDTVIDPASTVARTYRGRVYMHYNNVI